MMNWIKWRFPLADASLFLVISLIQAFLALSVYRGLHHLRYFPQVFAVFASIRSIPDICAISGFAGDSADCAIRAICVILAIRAIRAIRDIRAIRSEAPGIFVTRSMAKKKLSSMFGL